MLTSLPTMLLTIASIVSDRQKILDELSSRDKWLNSYDYIVCGAGNAGAVVAARLSEDHMNTVLLLEAGEQPIVEYDIPVGISYKKDLSSYLWHWYTVPQEKVCLLNPNHMCNIPTGRVLGGGSGVNGMVYMRGNRNDFDNWEKTYGAKGWSYNDVLRFYLKSENNSDLELVNNYHKYHSTGGPLGVTTHKNADPIYKTYLKAANRLGYETVDMNADNQTGIGIMQSTITWDGCRASTANSFLIPNRKRKNLHIITSAFVTKILFRKVFKKITASGVQFERNGQQFKVNAKKEVILSTGALRSPQILMLSGIGSENHLKELKLPVIKDLPVGNNFHDHVFVNIVLKIKNQCNVYRKDTEIENLYKHFVEKDDSNLAKRETIYTVFSTSCNTNNDWPNAHIQSATTINPDLCQQVFNIQPILIRPKSRGTIRLSSTNPRDNPLIDPKFYSDDNDMETMLEIVEQTLRMLNTPEFKEFSELHRPISESCKPCIDDEYCESFLKCIIGTGDSYGHPVGSCRMGSANDSQAVVDEKLRVRGVNRLRVCDASIMPQITSSGTNAPSIMIGERCAQFVINDN